MHHALKEMILSFAPAPVGLTEAEEVVAERHQMGLVRRRRRTNRLAKTLRALQSEILAFFDTRLTNEPTEVRNLIIKQAKARQKRPPTKSKGHNP